MKAVTMSFLMATVALGAQAQDTAPDHWGQRVDTRFEDLAEAFAHPNMRYAPFMFWFWDEPLDAEKMVEMAGKMISQGINPGYAHPRRSMNQAPSLPDEQWLGEAWFDAFNAVTATAKKHGAYFGYVDEYWWPSLRAHGRVLEANPELEACSLATDTIELEGGESSVIPKCSFAVAAALGDDGVIAGDTLRIITEGEARDWRAPEGTNWRVYTFTKQTRRDVNCVDPRLGPAFIDIAIKPYEEHCGDELGQTILGDFVDTEGGYGTKLVWSDALASRYGQRFGRDIREQLPLMLDRDLEGAYRKVRWQWFDLVSDIYVENFKSVVDWHEDRGMYCIANFWEESLPAQVLRVGDHMKMQRAYTMPGQDALHDGVLYAHDFKEAVSVAELENRRVFSEMLGASQWYRFHPTLLKKALNSVTTWGISHMAPHGVFTNRDLTGNIWPPDWYTENPLFAYLHLWADFARRASFVNSHGHQEAKVLLYSPIESVWTLTGGFHFDSREPGIGQPWSFPEEDPGAKRANMIDRAYAKAMNDLVKGRIDHLAVDRHYLKAMTLNDGLLKHGAFSFDTLVLPPLDILETEVAAKILAFAKGGGHVYCLGGLPAASVERGSNDSVMIELMEELNIQPACVTCRHEPSDVRATFKNHWMGWEYESDTDSYGLMPFIEAEAPGLRSPIRFLDGAFAMLQQHRIIDDAYFFWLANNTEKEQSPVVRLSNLTGTASIWHCETGARTKVPVAADADGLTIALEFEPLEAYWLVVDPGDRGAAESAEIEGDTIDETKLAGPWFVRYHDENQPELERVWDIPDALIAPQGHQTELIEWSALPGMPPRFTGFLDYYTTFEVSTTAANVIIDLGQVHDMAEVWVNGKHLGKKLWMPYRFELTEALTPGENNLRIRVGNRVNNYYTEPVPSGLLGPVAVVKRSAGRRP